MKLKSIKELGVSGKTVFVRVDFNVPLKDGKVEDDLRIRAALPTLEYLIGKKAKIIVASHLGRPAAWDEQYSMTPVAERLAHLLKRKFLVIDDGAAKLPDYAVPHVYFFPQNIETVPIKAPLAALKPGDIAVIENLRFYKGEKAGDEELAKKLAAISEVYVNEAFSNSHRAHASMLALPRLLPAVAGLNLLADVLALTRIRDAPKAPFVVMMGGVKLADKAPALRNLAPRADHILLGGGLANLFLRVMGFQIGKSVAAEKDEEPIARQILRDHKDKVLLPRDVVVSSSREGAPEVVAATAVKPHHLILDIGPQAILEYSTALKEANTILWAGALGYFENRAFSHGTFALARLMASRCRGRAYGVAGGGETLQVIAKLQLSEYFDHLSTAGGAMLDFLAGKSMPGLEALQE